MSKKVTRTRATKQEIAAAHALAFVTFLPASFDKRFARGIQEIEEAGITDKQREYLTKIVHRYRRQIPTARALLPLSVEGDE